MLTCKEQVARSSDFLDGQLNVRERFQVRHHLLFCPNCRRFLKQMRLMRTTLRAMPEPPIADLDEIALRLAHEQQVFGKD
jgi:anti-sigma factor RsiW